MSTSYIEPVYFGVRQMLEAIVEVQSPTKVDAADFNELVQLCRDCGAGSPIRCLALSVALKLRNAHAHEAKDEIPSASELRTMCSVLEIWLRELAGNSASVSLNTTLGWTRVLQSALLWYESKRATRKYKGKVW